MKKAARFIEEQYFMPFMPFSIHALKHIEITSKLQGLLCMYFVQALYVKCKEILKCNFVTFIFLLRNNFNICSPP